MFRSRQYLAIGISPSAWAQALFFMEKELAWLSPGQSATGSGRNVEP
jgi:hypothetical protein